METKSKRIRTFHPFWYTHRKHKISTYHFDPFFKRFTRCCRTGITKYASLASSAEWVGASEGVLLSMMTLSPEHEWYMLFPLSSSFKPARMLCFACHPSWQHKQGQFIFKKEHYFALHVVQYAIRYKQSSLENGITSYMCTCIQWGDRRINTWRHDSYISNNWPTIRVIHSIFIHSVPLQCNAEGYFWVMIGVHIY